MNVSSQITQFHKMLGNISAWLDDASTFAGARDMDPELMLPVRLYPDQFTLRRNIQSCCDIAKLTAARLSGVDAPTHEDGDQTIEELKARIAEVQAFVAGIDSATLDAASDKWISPKLFQGMGMTGADYVTEFGGPNFYFHVTTTYAILRNMGVPLGKRAFLGRLSLSEAPA